MHVWPRPSPLPATLIGGAILAAAALAFGAAGGSVLPFVALIALGTVVATVADWTLGIPVLLFIGCTDGFIKHLSSSPATYILKDALLALILLGLVWRAVGLRDQAADVRWRGMAVWAIYVAFMVTQLVHPAGSLAGAFGAFRAHAAFALLLPIGALYFRKGARLERTANLVIALGVLIAVGAIAQQLMGTNWMLLGPGFAQASVHYTTWPSVEVKSAGGGDDATYRMYGTLVDPAALGIASAYAMLFAIASLGRLRGWGRLATIAAIPLIGVSLGLSESRASIGGLTAGLVVLTVLLALRKATRAFAVAGIVLVALAVPAALVLTHGSLADRITAQDQVAYAAQTRIESEAVVLDQLPQAPFGHGLGATGAGGNLRVDSGLAVDNVYFATLYETGVLGLVLFLAVQLTLLGLGIRAMMRARTTGTQTVFAGIVAAQCAVLASCWYSQGNFDYAPIAEFFWLFAGAVVRSDAWA